MDWFDKALDQAWVRVDKAEAARASDRGDKKTAKAAQNRADKRVKKIAKGK